MDPYLIRLEQNFMTSLTLKQAVGQLFIVGFEGTRLPIPLTGALMKDEVGGVILFRRNITDAAQLLALTQSIRDLKLKFSPWIAVDQEGGKVQRLAENVGLSKRPSAAEIGRLSADETFAYARDLAKEVRHFGFNLNFAPVLDIHTNPDNPIIGDRAYATTPQAVIDHAIPMINGFLAEGLVPCGKHFPGHGDTDTDSHLDTPVVRHTLDRLRNVEFKPFEAAIEAKIPMIMTAHIVMQGIGERFPSTLSPLVVTDLLRKSLGFEGVIVSDDLEMNAIIDNYSCLKAVLLGLRAGVDLFLICKSQYLWAPLCKQVVEEAKKDRELERRIFESAERILALKNTFLSTTEA